MNFDYYTAGIEANPDHVIGHLESSYDLCSVIPSTPKNGYERAYSVSRGETVLARVQYGGPSVGTRVWVSASGDKAPEFAGIIRAGFPVHSLLRADVAIDYCEPGAWESLYNLGLQTADMFKLKARHVGDYHRAEDGRTLYVGSRSSPAMQRIYEKGKQTGGDPDHVRSELELKPQNANAKLAYASATPEQMWMATKWTQHVLRVLTGLTGMQPAPPGTVRTMTDHERAISFMGKQYGKIIAHQLELLGGDMEAIALWIVGLATDNK